jgi:hypothetical protein
MDKEQLRMQFLSGIITEGEYKAKLEEETEFKSELGGGNLMLNNASKQIYQYIKKNGFPVRLVTDKGQVIGDPNPNFIVSTKTDYLTKFDQKQGIDGLKSIITKIGISGGGLYISGIGTNAPVVKDKLEGLQRDILSSFNFLEKAGEVQVGPTGGGFALRIKPDMLKKGQVTESLNENFVGMGMVGNIFERDKTDYELAFEHFAKGISLEEGNLGSGEIWSIEREGRFWIVSWRGMEGPKEKVFSSEDEAREFASTLDENK